MAEQTTSSLTVSATPAEVMAVIADFESYPEWTGAVKEAEVLTEYEDDGRPAEVRFRLDSGALKDEYVLEYEWDGDDEVRWGLVEASLLKAMDGAYTLVAVPGGTEVTYRLAVDVSIPVLGLMKRKAEKVIIDTALTELKRRVEAAR